MNHGQALKMTTDPLFSRRLRPLMPRPFTSCSTNSSCAFSTTPTHSCSLHNPNIHSWNQPLGGVSDHGGKREMNRGLQMVSSRWNPTPEQLQALEEMYRRGTKTPTAEQIQQIAAKLRRFGKIEGKNVFYWFQNHKARDRQKKRRQLELLAGKNNREPQRRQSGLSRRCLEIEHPKKLPTTSNCRTASKNFETIHGAMVQECRRDEWTQMDTKELQQKFTDEKATGQENACYPFVASLSLCKQLTSKNDYFRNFESEIKENQTTLQLFPIKDNELSAISVAKEESSDGSSIGTKLVPNQFIEFLPTKN